MTYARSTIVGHLQDIVHIFSLFIVNSGNLDAMTMKKKDMTQQSYCLITQREIGKKRKNYLQKFPI